MPEIILTITLSEEGGSKISCEEVIAEHTPDLTRNKKVSISEETLYAMTKRVITAYDRETWALAKRRAENV